MGAASAATGPRGPYTEVQVPLLQRTMEYGNAPVLALCCQANRTAPPSPDRGVAAVRVLAVRHPIPRHPAVGLLPDMSESSGTPGARTALGVLLPQCFPSQALPAPHSGDHNYLGRGMGVEQKTSFGSISSSGEPSRYFPATEGSRFVR